VIRIQILQELHPQESKVQMVQEIESEVLQESRSRTTTTIGAHLKHTLEAVIQQRVPTPSRSPIPFLQKQRLGGLVTTALFKRTFIALSI